MQPRMTRTVSFCKGRVDVLALPVAQHHANESSKSCAVHESAEHLFLKVTSVPLKTPETACSPPRQLGRSNSPDHLLCLVAVKLQIKSESNLYSLTTLLLILLQPLERDLVTLAAPCSLKEARFTVFEAFTVLPHSLNCCSESVKTSFALLSLQW